MKILLVAATQKELQPVKKAIQISFSETNDYEIDFLTTGIGLRNATTKIITSINAAPKYNLVINLGLAGSPASRINVGDVFFPTSFHAFRNKTIETISLTDNENRLSDGLPKTWIRGGLFSSEKPVVSNEQKSAATFACGVLAVDMEAFALSESCRRADIPFLSLKIISDRADSAAHRTFFRELNKNLAILSVETMLLIRHILKQTEPIHG